jgi:hypothetical protein
MPFKYLLIVSTRVCAHETLEHNEFEQHISSDFLASNKSFPRNIFSFRLLLTLQEYNKMNVKTMRKNGI